MGERVIPAKAGIPVPYLLEEYKKREVALHIPLLQWMALIGAAALRGTRIPQIFTLPLMAMGDRLRSADWGHPLRNSLDPDAGSWSGSAPGRMRGWWAEARRDGVPLWRSGGDHHLAPTRLGSTPAKKDQRRHQKPLDTNTLMRSRYRYTSKLGRNIRIELASPHALSGGADIFGWCADCRAAVRPGTTPAIRSSTPRQHRDRRGCRRPAHAVR